MPQINKQISKYYKYYKLFVICLFDASTLLGIILSLPKDEI